MGLIKFMIFEDSQIMPIYTSEIQIMQALCILQLISGQGYLMVDNKSYKVSKPQFDLDTNFLGVTGKLFKN